MTLLHRLRKTLIDTSGYWFYKRKHLPIGADFLEDVKNRLDFPLNVIFDVGANYGQTAEYYSKSFPDAKIYSFEPVKSSFEKLTANTKNLLNVAVFQNAFGNAEKTVEIALFDENQSQLNSLKESSNKADAVKETIRVTTIDSFLKSEGIAAIDLLKIDTEGYEVEVLTGAFSSIRAGKIKLVLCEVALSAVNQKNTPICSVIEFLLGNSYTLLGLYDTNINYLKEGLAYSNALFVKN